MAKKKHNQPSEPGPNAPPEVARDKKYNRRIFKHGMLVRRTDILKQWKPAWIVVREDKFCWYKDQKSAEEANKKSGGMPYVDGLADTEDEYEMGGRKHVFSFNSRGKTTFIQCSSDEERAEWIAIIKKVVKGEI
jgi:hypothetical protein